MEVKTIADKTVYTRVPQIKEKIDNSLIDKLVNQGYDRKNIKIKTEEINNPGRTCVKQITVIAYIEESVENILDKDFEYGEQME